MAKRPATIDDLPKGTADDSPPTAEDTGTADDSPPTAEDTGTADDSPPTAEDTRTLGEILSRIEKRLTVIEGIISKVNPEHSHKFGD